MSHLPTLINLPPPPSDPVTPSDVPGTPNSTTTSMSELSTVAIKDGHRGHLHSHHHQPDAERADRISRLAGLERIATARGGGSLTPGAGGNAAAPVAYFDQNNTPQVLKERSTVGSASATGSVGGRTTWASESDMYDPDKMSEDQDVETSSVGGFSDEGTQSLVGFGEGARTPSRQLSGIGSPVVGKGGVLPPHMREQQGAASPMSGVSVGSSATTPSTEAQRQDARMIDGMTYDANVPDTTARTPQPIGAGTDVAQKILGTRLDAHGGLSEPAEGGPKLGKFNFEERN